MSRLLPERPRNATVLGMDAQHMVWDDAPARGARRADRWVDVVAGNDLAVHWVQSPPASVASLAELRLVAQARCVRLFGEVADGWRLAADWRIGRPFVCSALPQRVMTAVERQLAGPPARIRWHSAWSALTLAMGTAFPAEGWSAVRTPQRVMLWHCRGGAVDCLTSWPAARQEDSQVAARQACQQMRVASSRSEHLVPGLLHWLDMLGANGVGAMRDVVVVPLPAGMPPADGAATEAQAALRWHALAVKRGLAP